MKKSDTITDLLLLVLEWLAALGANTDTANNGGSAIASQQSLRS